MRIASYILFTCDEIETRTIYESANIKDKINPSWSYQNPELFVDSTEYEKLISELQKRQIKYEERFRRVFSLEELESAEYLSMRGGNYWSYPQPESGYRKLCLDLSTACPLCGNGARQIAPFMVKKPPPEKKRWVMLHWVYEHLVSDRLARMMQEKDFTGCAFWPILHYKTREEIADWKQLFFKHELPPMASKTEFPIVAKDPDDPIFLEFGLKPTPLCPCGKTGRNVPDVFYYNRKDFGQFKDFNKSFEWRGGGATTWQMMIISQRVFQFIQEQHFKHPPAIFEPIEWVDG